MSIFGQIMLGSLFLAACSAFHVLVLSLSVPLVNRVDNRCHDWRPTTKMITVLFVALVSVIASHTVQIWLWAFNWIQSGAMRDWNEAIYFSIVTYTTLGYGDVILGTGHRIFATFAAITGLLSFGISTAFLVGIFTRMLSRVHQP